MKTGTLFCDGGARGNPGPGAGAAVLYDGEKNRLDGEGRYLGETTNNVAEYQGVLLGLRLARKHGIRHLQLRLDSELIVRQLEGVYKVRQPHLQPLWAEAKKELETFSSWEVRHVPRAENKEADRLVNEVLDAQGKKA